MTIDPRCMGPIQVSQRCNANSSEYRHHLTTEAGPTPIRHLIPSQSATCSFLQEHHREHLVLRCNRVVLQLHCREPERLVKNSNKLHRGLWGTHPWTQKPSMLAIYKRKQAASLKTKTTQVTKCLSPSHWAKDSASLNRKPADWGTAFFPESRGLHHTTSHHTALTNK